MHTLNITAGPILKADCYMCWSPLEGPLRVWHICAAHIHPTFSPMGDRLFQTTRILNDSQ